MKVRAIANGNIVEMAPEEAQPLIDAGIFELIFEKIDEPKADPAKEEAPAKKRAPRG